ncbi:hypothetical protein MUJ63_04255 [Lachnospiraceae bacterium NSJ-143]|nr:hypothetical protein [Lachnospiraceae bacterium NSJ-143]
MTLKKYAVCAVMILSVFSLSACSNSSEVNKSAEQSAGPVSESSEESFKPENIAESALKKTIEMKSYRADMDISFDYSGEGEKSKTSNEIKTEILSVTSPVFKHIIVTPFLNGEKYDITDIYVDENESGGKTIYSNYADNWYRYGTDDAGLYLTVGQYDIREFLNVLLTSLSDINVGGIEDINGTKAYRVEAVVPKDKVAGFVIDTGIFAVVNITNLYENYFDKVQEIPVVFYVNSETGNVVSVSFDAQNALQAISDFAYESVEGTKGYEDKKRLVADKYEVKINVYDIDNVSKTEIPAEALNGTKLDDIIANPTENSGTAE